MRLLSINIKSSIIKKIIVILFLLCCFIMYSSSLTAKQNYRDSLRTFLEYIQEDSITIFKILNSKYARKSQKLIECYLMFNERLEYNNDTQELIWNHGWSDSIFSCKCAEYLTDKIIRDSSINLIYPCLLQAFLINHNKYSGQILVKCAEYCVDNFHSRDAIIIPILYHSNCDESNNYKEILQYYDMVNFILNNSKHLYYFDNNTNKQLNSIIAESTGNSKYYNKFRNFINSLTDNELARITLEEKEYISNILLQGIQNQEKKSIMTYAFLFLTGQFTEKNEELGKKLLSLLTE